MLTAATKFIAQDKGNEQCTLVFLPGRHISSATVSLYGARLEDWFVVRGKVIDGINALLAHTLRVIEEEKVDVNVGKNVQGL